MDIVVTLNQHDVELLSERMGCGPGDEVDREAASKIER